MTTPMKFVAGMNVTVFVVKFTAPFVVLTPMMVRLPPGLRTTSFVSGIKVPVVFSVMLTVSGFASGGKFVTMVTTGGVKLFVGIGSSVGPPTLATFVALPRCVEMTVSVKLLAVFAARLEIFQMTWLLAFVVVLGTELTNAKPFGKLSVTIKLVAVEGPPLLTMML